MVAERRNRIGASSSGIVLASYGRGVLVESGRQLLQCSLKGRKQRIVCGDRVVWAHRPADDGASVESIEPRRNLIERIDARGRPEPVAANIDRLAVVVAPEPAPDWFLVDRYWAGARLKDIDTLLIVNKSDLGARFAARRIRHLPRAGAALLRGLRPSRTGASSELRAASGRGHDAAGRPIRRGEILAVNALAPEAAAQTGRADAR